MFYYPTCPRYWFGCQYYKVEARNYRTGGRKVSILRPLKGIRSAIEAVVCISERNSISHTLFYDKKLNSPKESQILRICPAVGIKSRWWHNIPWNRLLEFVRRKVRCIHNRTEPWDERGLDVPQSVPVYAVEKVMSLDLVNWISFFCRGEQAK